MSAIPLEEHTETQSSQTIPSVEFLIVYRKQLVSNLHCYSDYFYTNLLLL